MEASTIAEIEIDEILAAVSHRERVRCALPGGGVLNIDRGLPYLLVHRQRPGEEDAGTARLVSGEASYLLAKAGQAQEIGSLVAAVAEAGSAVYGAFLLLEIWSATDAKSSRWVVHGPRGPAPETVSALVEGLRTLCDVRPDLDVAVDTGDQRQPPGLQPLLSVHEGWERGILLLGLEVPPIYRDPETDEVFPRFLRRVQHRLSKVLRQALYEFMRIQTTERVANYHALGTSNVPGSIWESDRQLASIQHSFDFLLLTSPVNNEPAWEQFQAADFGRPPDFHYRLLPVDPDLLKRRLFAIEMEAIDDPALSSLFQDKRQELDRQLSMLNERGTPAFRHSSMRLYGEMDDRLLGVAERLLTSVPPPSPNRANGGAWVGAYAFRDAAAEELAYYTTRHRATADRRIVVRPDLVGLMVSEGNLLIGEGLRLDAARVPALLNHEVGTHVLTYVNGAAQPMEQLALGLADYDELQEGLAVLSEYLVGGLDRSRMRLLAARVVAAHAVEQGSSFVDTFRLLTREHGFPPRRAWHIATRVHTCGGFTRDLIYLRGLIGLLDHLNAGGELEPLYIGKIALKHAHILEELRHRSVLREPPLSPRFLGDPEARRRLEIVRGGIELEELLAPEEE